jgi:molybdopterin converting factor small subunit
VSIYGKDDINVESPALENLIQEIEGSIPKQNFSLHDVSIYRKDDINVESPALENLIQEIEGSIPKQNFSLHDVSIYGKDDINVESPALENLIQGNEESIPKQNFSLYNTTITPKDIFLVVNRNNKVEKSYELQQKDIYDNTLIITKENNKSIELVLEPDGIGKLDIELTQKKGVINAQFNVAETIGKELLDKNLNYILHYLTAEGIAIGNFSVSLNNRKYRDKIERNISDGGTRYEKITDKIDRLISHNINGNISIFV